MDKELKKDIKTLLFIDTLLSSSTSISSILDDVEDELEEILGKTRIKDLKIEDLFKIETLK
jgi:hypothetical protein